MPPYPFPATSTFGYLCSPSHEVSISLRRNMRTPDPRTSQSSSLSECLSSLSFSGLETMVKSCTSKHAQTESLSLSKYKDRWLTQGVISAHNSAMLLNNNNNHLRNRVPNIEIKGGLLASDVSNGLHTGPDSESNTYISLKIAQGPCIAVALGSKLQVSLHDSKVRTLTNNKKEL